MVCHPLGPLSEAGPLWFYGTLVFVAVTIPAGLYSRFVLGQSLANVDWLHGTAESLLTVANILVVLGFKQALERSGKSAE